MKKIWNFRIGWHKHKWEKVVIFAQESLSMSIASEGYLLKVAEKCVASNCDCGSFRSVYYIKLKEAPKVISIS